jgi:glycosyltransferase involved in cell wall biosynthesis
MTVSSTQGNTTQGVPGWVSASTTTDPLTVSVIIKALNEERHIAAAIESALAAIHGIDGEVILADSGSSDRTIEIARQYPIRVVRLNNTRERSCGVGAQLGFQYSCSSYLCLMDGDMRLQSDFVGCALEYLECNPTVAGVGGYIADRELSNLEFEQRTRRYDPDRLPGLVTRLNSSGVYRRSAIETIRYLTDRNLHGAEEFDLAARLHTQGWMLAKIDRHAIDHFGHSGNAYRLLVRRIATRNACATGEVVRAAIGRPHFWLIVKDRNTLLCLTIAVWWVAIACAPLLLSDQSAVLAALGLLLLSPIMLTSLRWRSLRRGLYSLTALNVYTLSFLPGFLRSRADPTRWIDSSIVHDSTARRHSCQRRDCSADAAELSGIREQYPNKVGA